MLESIIERQYSLTERRRLNVEKLNTKVKTLKVYEIVRNSFRYFVTIDGTAVKSFETYEEAFDYIMELSNDDD